MTCKQYLGNLPYNLWNSANLAKSKRGASYILPRFAFSFSSFFHHSSQLSVFSGRQGHTPGQGANLQRVHDTTHAHTHTLMDNVQFPNCIYSFIHPSILSSKFKTVKTKRYHVGPFKIGRKKNPAVNALLNFPLFGTACPAKFLLCCNDVLKGFCWMMAVVTSQTVKAARHGVDERGQIPKSKSCTFLKQYTILLPGWFVKYLFLSPLVALEGFMTLPFLPSYKLLAEGNMKEKLYSAGQDFNLWHMAFKWPAYTLPV